MGDGCRYGSLIVAPLSSRGVLKWHSLLKVHLAINESTSARVQLKLENALLARFWTLKVQVTPSKEKGKMSSSHSLIGWCIVYVDLVFGVAIGGGRCIARAIDCIVVVGNAVEHLDLARAADALRAGEAHIDAGGQQGVEHGLALGHAHGRPAR